VDDTRLGKLDRASHLLGPQAAAQQPDRRAAPSEPRRGAGEQLRRLAQVLAHEPQQVFHRALLAAGCAVAVVQEQNHPVPGAYWHPGKAPRTRARANLDCPDVNSAPTHELPARLMHSPPPHALPAHLMNAPSAS
jgi:hypothetical protein